MRKAFWELSNSRLEAQHETFWFNSIFLRLKLRGSCFALFLLFFSPREENLHWTDACKDSIQTERRDAKRGEEKVRSGKIFIHPREKLSMWRKPILRFMNQVETRSAVSWKRNDCERSPSERSMEKERERRAFAMWERARNDFMWKDKTMASRRL